MNQSEPHLLHHRHQTENLLRLHQLQQGIQQSTQQAVKIDAKQKWLSRTTQGCLLWSFGGSCLTQA
jgi:hypothetical protein